jgi:hypothetical protein
MLPHHHGQQAAYTDPTTAIIKPPTSVMLDEVLIAEAPVDIDQSCTRHNDRQQPDDSEGRSGWRY